MKQIEHVIEEMKAAMLAKIPIVYLPTDDIDLVQRLLYSKQYAHALIPRIGFNYTDDSISLLDENNSDMSDNYQRNDNYPFIWVKYDGWEKGSLSELSSFLNIYLGVTDGKIKTAKTKTDVYRRSLVIVVSPTYEQIPAKYAPYVKTVHVPVPTDEEIVDTICSFLLSQNIQPTIIYPEQLSKMIVSLRGFSITKILQMLRIMVAEHNIDYESIDMDSVMSTIRDAKRALLENSIGLKWEQPSEKKAAGLKAVESWLINHRSIFEDPELASHHMIDIPKGILISGIPGSGKSLIAKQAAQTLKMPLISLDMGAMLGSLNGDSEHNMANALTMAEQMAPCVLWIDEIEKAFSGSSQDSSGDSGVGRRMFGKFLTWMQEKRAACFVFATANDISMLPPELFRAERFDKKYFTFMPTAEECATIFASNIKTQNETFNRHSTNTLGNKNDLLFDKKLETEGFWSDLLDELFSPIGELLDDSSGEPQWKDESHRPHCKLMNGADIASVIREVKFKLHPNPDCPLPSGCAVFSADNVRTAVESIFKDPDFKPYGETNLRDIVKCFVKLYQNQFAPASGNCIIDFNCFDEDSVKYRPDRKVWFKNSYDTVLYGTMVGAINRYAIEYLKR